MLRLLEVFSKVAQRPGQSPRNSVLAGGGGTGCNRTMSQSLGASRTLGAPGLSVICQEGRLGRLSPPGTSLQGQNVSLAVGPPGSPLLCSAASVPVTDILRGERLHKTTDLYHLEIKLPVPLLRCCRCWRWHRTNHMY